MHPKNVKRSKVNLKSQKSSNNKDEENKTESRKIIENEATDKELISKIYK